MHSKPDSGTKSPALQNFEILETGKAKAPSIRSDRTSGVSANQPPICPVCGGTAFRSCFRSADRLYRTTDREFNVAECRGCGLMRLLPQPTAAELREWYPKSYWL